ncbi:MAG: elongation factor P [Candidatus Zixiibacteriota bacterium]|jgi:elongation factor P
MINTNDLRAGKAIELDGTPYVVTKFAHVKPGKGPAFVRVTLKNLLTGASHEQTLRSSEKVKTARLDERTATFMYATGDEYHFMDENTYEEFALPPQDLDDAAQWLKDGTSIKLVFYEGRPVAVEVPNFLELTITETDPGVRGDTASGGSKAATLETGAVVNVPLFINEGDIIRVDTRSGDYVDRVK